MIILYILTEIQKNLNTLRASKETESKLNRYQLFFVPISEPKRQFFIECSFAINSVTQFRAVGKDIRTVVETFIFNGTLRNSNQYFVILNQNLKNLTPKITKLVTENFSRHYQSPSYAVMTVVTSIPQIIARFHITKVLDQMLPSCSLILKR